MDGSLSTKANMELPQELQKDTAASKRRKVVQKTVLTVRMEENAGKQKVEGPPSDSWSWRKYGQKPIKGSPYPRGYYRCSTSKGCSAKKQVERCKTDASMLIITYTSDHNHTSPDLSKLKNPATTPLVTDQPNSLDLPNSNSQEVPLQFPPKCSEDSTNQHDPTMVLAEKTQDHLNIIVDEEGPLPYPHNMIFSTTPSKPAEEDNFFDELEELPISSSFTSLVRSSSSFFDERIILPSQTI